MNIINNLKSIKENLISLKSSATTIVVCKNQSIVKVKDLIDHGHLDFGENKVQEAQQKWQEILNLHKNIKLHLIGKLQSNKVKQAFHIFNYIHSLDNEKLARSFSDLENFYKRNLKYFVQVNIGDEPQKNGISTEKLKPFIEYCVSDLKLNVIGLMCIPPLKGDPSVHFKKLAELAKENNLNELSMGMSNDYVNAINNGATFIRIGSKIFN